MKTYIFILITSLLTLSCANSKKATQAAALVEEQQVEEAVDSAQKAILTQNWSKYDNSASYNILAASLTGNNLTITMNYQGGCETHEFDLIGSAFIMKSLPPKRGIKLYHHPVVDDCRELVQKSLTFDISDFRYGNEEIILNLEHYSTSISYTKKAE